METDKKLQEIIDITSEYYKETLAGLAKGEVSKKKEEEFDENTDCCGHAE